MAWIVAAAWGFAALVAAVLWGFGLYELSWKRARLVRDLGVLRRDLDQLNEVTARLAAVAHRPVPNSGS